MIRPSLFLGFAILLAAAPRDTVRVLSLQGKPVRDIVLAAADQPLPATDRGGKTRLPAEAPKDEWWHLQVAGESPADVLISPWDNWISTSSAETGVIVARRGDTAILANSRALASLAARIIAASAPDRDQPETLADRRRAALLDVAKEFALAPDPLGRALRDLAARSPDPFEKGISLLFQLKTTEALPHLALARVNEQKRLDKIPESIFETAFFLGQAFFEAGKFDDAVLNYRRALDQRPADPVGRRSLGMALIKSGHSEAAEPYLSL